MPRYVHAAGRLAVGGAAMPATANNPAKQFPNTVQRLIAKAGHFHKSGDLFTGPPTVADVRQAMIGDCFLLASVAAILAQPNGSDYILDMMRDQGDGTVVIRFSDGVNPQLVRVQKSVLGPGLHNRGALWLQILEKGYASFKGSYRLLATGASPNIALSALLGRDEFTIEFAERGRSPDRALLDRCMTHRPGLPPGMQAQIKNGVLDGSDVHWNNWSTWLQANAIATKWPAMVASKIMVRLEHFEAFMDEYAGALDRTTRDQVVRWVYLNQVLPGKRGTGVYTAAEMRLYTNVQQALANRRPVALSTPNTFTKIDGSPVKTSGVGHSAGEGKYKGLAAKHAYAVIRCEPRGILRGIVVRNPWGKRGYGRAYTGDTPGGMSARTTSEAESWLELSDVSKFFSDVDIGGVVGQVA